MIVYKLLAIVVVTAAVTLLCIRSGQAMTKNNPSPLGTVYQTTDHKLEPTDHGKFLAVTTTTPTAFTFPDHDVVPASSTATTVTVNSVPANERNESSRATDTAVTDETTTKNRTATDHVQTISRALSDRLDRDHRFGHQSVSRSRSVVRGRLIKSTTQSSNQLGNNPEVRVAVRSDEIYDDTDDDGNSEAKIIVDAGTYHTHNRPRNRHPQLIRNDYATVDTDASISEEDGSAAYHNMYDLTYSAIDNQKAQSTGWTAMKQPGQAYPINGNAIVPGRHTHPSSYPYPARYTRMPGPSGPVNYKNYMPADEHYQWHNPNSHVGQFNIDSPLQQIQMFYDKVDWQKIGILVLLKLGLAKLKLFGFLKLLFLLVFKLKLYLIAMFFKFLLIMKLMKFFKLLTLPLILLTLLPSLATLASVALPTELLSIPTRLLQLLTENVYVPEGNAVATKNAVNKPIVLRNASSLVAKTFPSDMFKVDNSSSIGRRRMDALELFDPSMVMFRKVLRLDKCVERIACRMAVVEKAGIVPAWINWMLKRISIFIPNGKLVSYLKAYDNVSNVINFSSKTPKNWASWCSEYYTCNDTNTFSVTNVTDSK